jgi:Family of unknown function (DUF5990)
MTPVRFRIRGRNLPGRQFAGHGEVRVGVQVGREVPDPVPGDAEEAVFEMTVNVTDDLDFRGPAVQGRRGERFIYLSWGDVSSGQFEMFRRAKLHLSTIEDHLVREAVGTGAVVEATVGLTDARGGPLCAAVRPPVIGWRLSA